MKREISAKEKKKKKLRPQPRIRKYLEEVTTVIRNAIPEDAFTQCYLENGERYDDCKGDKFEFLNQFVREKLNRIAKYEYSNWLNGRMPFVTFRELQIWRLRQFAEHIWFWDTPDDDDVAVIFNLTKKRASNLVWDFYARFRKLYAYPILIRRLLNLLANDKRIIGKEGGEIPEAFVFEVPSRRYVDEVNALLPYLSEKFPKTYLRRATIYKKNERHMWVDAEVVRLLRLKNVRLELEAKYPVHRPISEELEGEDNYE